MINYSKKLYIQILIFLILLIVTITFIIPSPYDRIFKKEYDETFRNYEYFKAKATKDTTFLNISSGQLFDISNFTFLIKPNRIICDKGGENNTKIRVVYIVTSHINNIEARSAMRRAFSNNFLRTVGVRRVFLLDLNVYPFQSFIESLTKLNLLFWWNRIMSKTAIKNYSKSIKLMEGIIIDIYAGVTPDNKYINQKSVEDEARRYNDIVQGNFEEAYRNLTYKHVMGLKWVSQYCSKTKFVIKMDDDIIVNILKTMNLLNQWNAEKEFIAGYILKGLKAKRLKANKWFVTKEEYPSNLYPPFASGWFYITTPTVCTKLLKLTNSEKYFWIDDVFVTGILAEKIHIKKYDIKGYFTDHPEYFQCCLDDLLKYKFDCDILVGPNGGRTDLFFEFNQAFSKCVEHKCLKRSFPMNESCVGTKTLHLGRGDAVISTYKLI